VAKSILTTPGFKLGSLNDDDIADIPLVQVVGRVAASGSRVLVAQQDVEHVTFGFNQVSFPLLYCLTVDVSLQLAIASKAEHTNSNAPQAQPKVRDQSSDLTLSAEC
jgi:hypothetical protein